MLRRLLSLLRNAAAAIGAPELIVTFTPIVPLTAARLTADAAHCAGPVRIAGHDDNEGNPAICPNHFGALPMGGGPAMYHWPSSYEITYEPSETHRVEFAGQVVDFAHIALNNKSAPAFRLASLLYA